MQAPAVRIAAVLALIVAAAAGYRWWSSPERQIRAILSDVAAAFTHREPEDGLDTLTAVAALQKHLAPLVVLEGGPVRISGRDQAVTAAARVRRASPAMRVRFIDPQITLTGGALADVSVTAEVTARTSSGEDVVDLLAVRARLERSDGRWVVTSAHTAAEDPQS